MHVLLLLQKEQFKMQLNYLNLPKEMKNVKEYQKIDL